VSAAPKLAIWKGMPFRYRDVGWSREYALEVIQYDGGPYWDVVENSRGPDAMRTQAVFLGPLADVEKVAFQELVNKPGPGILIHPDFGIVNAWLKSATESSNGAVSGIVTLDLEFIPISTLPNTEIAFAATADAYIVTLQAATLLNFEIMADVEDASAAGTGLRLASSAVSAAVSAAAAGLVSVDNQALFNVAVSVAAAGTASTAPGYWDNVVKYLDTVEAADAALASVIDGWTDAVALQTTDYTQGVAVSALYEYIGCSIIGRLCQLALAADYDTYDAAAGAASSLYENTRAAILLMTGNADVRGSLSVVNTAYTGLITDSLKLPRRATYTTESITSTVEMAYRLYGDIDRADEIEADNEGIIHPGFVPAGDWRVLHD
jgi:prophage DNA circulation protein